MTATDTSGLSVSDDFSATVIGAPVLQTQTANQSWNAGTAITLALPAGTFTDPQSEALTYTATQQNGQALPGWLTFNPATDSFSGTAPAAAQTLALKVTATDTSGLSVSDDFSATVIGAPVLVTQTANQNWNAGTAITLALPAGTFTDPQSEALTYTATQQNGQALPSWLTFNPTTDTFSGTAPASAQTLALKVTATDTSGLSVSDDFSATVIGAPVLQTQTANQSWNAGTAITLALPAGTFTDPQSEALTYTATQQNGQALPGWLTFNPATDSFSGTAPAAAQTLGIEVTATDASGLSVSDNFSATVIGAPDLVTQTANQNWTGGTAISLALPVGTFADPQGEALTYTATLQDGQGLPAWLTFNPTTDSFSGTAPASAQTLALEVTATDTSSLSVSDSFSATVIAAPIYLTRHPNRLRRHGGVNDRTSSIHCATFCLPETSNCRGCTLADIQPGDQSKASAAVVHGATNNDVINLGAGSDTVYLGGPGETSLVAAVLTPISNSRDDRRDDRWWQRDEHAVRARRRHRHDAAATSPVCPRSSCRSGTSYNFVANATAGLAHPCQHGQRHDHRRQRQPDGHGSPPAPCACWQLRPPQALRSWQQHGQQCADRGTIGLNNADRYVSVSRCSGDTDFANEQYLSITGSGVNDVFIAAANVLYSARAADHWRQRAEHIGVARRRRLQPGRAVGADEHPGGGCDGRPSGC